ncbi:hypothetical protein CWC12_01260 [Pseudoalteromonas ruthenica]|uniref:Uncharacterized protein n=1 Tax=Pseudoalteromonas ruthenica TaxID=151081 RepID=A0A0F4PNH9_9GAMM|nr:hypothetical protein TW76_14635 [Pseudoalteromonas ruthenica]KJZ00317.1 hypothetical protein TW72_06315 [Pseudoalteromonas ruthenica]TMO90123.1 hypothetical protein CWC12_01260 [Pseudoalteromonas ruthenica]TMO90778.1 hypothetical protein CWC13_18075 [Pseudoalteromonas ruthenica]TMP01015.1 hypothetical protein CWC07_01445 [Pseudoalteromonas ruthenica]
MLFSPACPWYGAKLKTADDSTVTVAAIAQLIRAKWAALWRLLSCKNPIRRAKNGLLRGVIAWRGHDAVISLSQYDPAHSEDGPLA